MYNILLVEDLAECQLVVRRALASSDLNLTIVESVRDAFAVLDATNGPDLMILDLDLREGEGFAVLEKLRSQPGAEVPVILFTDNSDLEMKLTAFQLGADDYLAKPISPVELRARIEMRLRKASKGRRQTSVLRAGDLTLDLSLMRATLGCDQKTATLPLTAKEFKLLALMAKNPGRVFSRNELISAVWGETVHVLDRTVDSHIFGLRKKLAHRSNIVECIPNVGYRYNESSNRDGSHTQAG